MVSKLGRVALSLATAAIFTAASPTWADVKAGVDAWTEGDYAAAVREWAELAAAGDPDAQFNMAQAYRLGRGVEADAEQAEALYAKAAAQGHVKAADNYGLMLFQREERQKAMRYIRPAAERGDPRAQYILGIAHFNGDFVEKDWTRAYALLTLANGSGLPQARPALSQMDEYIPMAERQEAQTLAAKLKSDAEAVRTRDLAAVDLALGGDSPSGPVLTTSPVSEGGNGTPGAGYASSAETAEPPRTATMDPVKSVVQPIVPPIEQVPLQSTPTDEKSEKAGPWKVQLGAFGVDGNAERLWAELSQRSELSGRTKLTKSAGRLTVLLAAGYSSQAAAQSACKALKASGHDCLVTR